MVAMYNDRCFNDLDDITNLNSILNFVANLDFTFSLINNRQDDIKFVGCRSTWFGVLNFQMAHKTLAHGQMNYHVFQFGHRNQEKADT